MTKALLDWTKAIKGSLGFSYLKVHDLLLVELAEGDAAGHEDGGRLGHAEDLPAEVLEKGGQLGLAGRLAAARAAREHQLVDASLRLNTLKMRGDSLYSPCISS